MKKNCSKLSLLILLTTVFLPLHLEAQEDNGVYTRTLEIEVQPADVPAWEAAVASIAEAIRAIESDDRTDWLVYRSGTANYFIVVNRFDLEEVVTLAKLYLVFDDAPEDSPLKSALTSLQTTNFTVIKDYLWQQHVALSTVQSMSTEAHPLAVVTEYSVQPADRAEFDSAMREYISFLKHIEYPYPVEGFDWRLGRPGRSMSVMFADSWVNFYGTGALEHFVDEKELGGELSRLRRHLLGATQTVHETYLTFAPELSP